MVTGSTWFDTTPLKVWFHEKKSKVHRDMLQTFTLFGAILSMVTLSLCRAPRLDFFLVGLCVHNDQEKKCKAVLCYLESFIISCIMPQWKVLKHRGNNLREMEFSFGERISLLLYLLILYILLPCSRIHTELVWWWSIYHIFNISCIRDCMYYSGNKLRIKKACGKHMLVLCFIKWGIISTRAEQISDCGMCCPGISMIFALCFFCWLSNVPVSPHLL